MPGVCVNTTTPGTGAYHAPGEEIADAQDDKGYLASTWFGAQRASDAPASLPLHCPWPMNRGLMGFDNATDLGTLASTWWDERIRYTEAGSAPFRITGLVKDANGVALGGAALVLYRSKGGASPFGSSQIEGGSGIAGDTPIQRTTSAGNGDALELGRYGFGVWDNTTQYYIRGENTDGTLIGTTVKTLTGS